MRNLLLISVSILVLSTMILGVDEIKPSGLNEVLSKLGAGYITGEPMKVGELLLVPIASVDFTFVNGEGFSANVVGGNVKVDPIGFLAIKGERVWFVPLEKEKPRRNPIDDFLKIYDRLAPIIMEIMKSHLLEKKQAPKSPSAPPVPPSLPESDPLSRAEELLKSGKLEEAYRVLDEFLKKQPENADAHALMGRICGELSSKTSSPTDRMRYGMRAFKEFEKALKIDPENITALIGYGYSQLYSPPPFGSVDKAVESFERVLKKDEKNVQALIGMAMALKKKGEVEKAKEYLSKVLAIDPKNSRALELMKELEEQ